MIWGVQVEDINSISTQLAERLICMFLESVRLVDSWFIRMTLRRECEPAVLPLRIPRPGLLKSSYVRARCVDLIVPLGLEVVKMLSIFIEVRDTSSGFLIGACSSFSHNALVSQRDGRTKGHQPEDDTLRGVLCYKRHVVQD
jgi:hypothetical protein